MQVIISFMFALFLVNGIPHYIKGLVGEKFYTPFSSPPTKGQSSPLVNVVWGLCNFFIAFLIYKFLIVNMDLLAFSLGVVSTSIVLSIIFTGNNHNK